MRGKVLFLAREFDNRHRNLTGLALIRLTLLKKNFLGQGSDHCRLDLHCLIRKGYASPQELQLQLGIGLSRLTNGAVYKLIFDSTALFV